LSLDTEGFEKAMSQQKQQARAAVVSKLMRPSRFRTMV
jgi:hypothetical protein